MKGVLQKIKPMHAALIPPDGAEPQGIIVRGQQLFRQIRRMARSIPLVRDGVRVFAKNPMTAEPLYPKRTHEMYDQEQLYTLESQGNFNVEKVPYRFPTPDELAAEKRAAAIKEMGGGQLGEALVDMGLTPQELIQRLMGGTATATAVAEPTPEVGYPHPTDKAGIWALSNGETMKGTKREAQEAEKALHEPVPEV